LFYPVYEEYLYYLTCREHVDPAGLHQSDMPNTKKIGEHHQNEITSWSLQNQKPIGAEGNPLTRPTEKEISKLEMII